MNKPKLNFLVDFLAFICLVAAIVSGVALESVPRGAEQSAPSALWGVERRAWSEIHEGTGMFLAILVVVHIIFHWRLIFGMTKSLFQPKKEEI